MPNALSPFGEKATGLLSGRFHIARLQLTLIYVLILGFIMCVSSASVYSAFSNQIGRRFERMPPHFQELAQDILPPRQEEVLADLTRTLFIVNGGLLLIAGIASYWLASLTLEPIQAAYDRQKRFLSDASHELRTPLSILQADLENAAHEETQTTASRLRIQSHLEEVSHMSQLVNDLLTSSRLDEQPESHTFQIVNLTTILEHVTERLQSTAKHHQVSLVMHKNDLPLFMFGNETQLMQIFSNVIKNAIIYNVDNGNVDISLKRERQYALIEIKDTGIGIAETDLPKIFERFYRADASRNRKTGGSGLGLAIVKASLAHMRGTIEVKSQLHKGTLVTLKLPLSSSS